MVKKMAVSRRTSADAGRLAVPGATPGDLKGLATAVGRGSGRDAAQPPGPSAEQLPSLAAALREREGWSWVDVAPAYTVQVQQWHEPAPTTRRTPSPQIEEELDRLYVEEGRCARVLDEMYRQAAGACNASTRKTWRMRIDAQERLCSTHGVRILEIEEQLQTCAPQILPWVGALITFSPFGGLMIIRHLVRAADWAEVQRRASTR